MVSPLPRVKSAESSAHFAAMAIVLRQLDEVGMTDSIRFYASMGHRPMFITVLLLLLLGLDDPLPMQIKWTFLNSEPQGRWILRRLCMFVVPKKGLGGGNFSKFMEWGS